MTYAEAVSVTKQCLQQYQAMAQLGEVLEKAARAEKYLSRAQAEVDSYGALVSKAKAEAQKELAACDASVEQARAKAAQAEEELTAQHIVKRTKFEAALRLLNGQVDDMKNKAATLEMESAARSSELLRVLQTLGAQKDALQNELDTLKSRVASLVG